MSVHDRSLGLLPAKSERAESGTVPPLPHPQRQSDHLPLPILSPFLSPLPPWFVPGVEGSLPPVLGAGSGRHLHSGTNQHHSAHDSSRLWRSDHLGKNVFHIIQIFYSNFTTSSDILLYMIASLLWIGKKQPLKANIAEDNALNHSCLFVCRLCFFLPSCFDVSFQCD